MNEENKDNKSELFILKLVLIVVFVFLFYFFFWDSVVEYGRPIISSSRNAFSFLGIQLGETKEILTGEKTFSLEGETEIRKKTGIELKELKPYGLDFGSFDDEFGVNTEIKINEFDENFNKINGKAGCYLYSDLDKFEGEIESDHKKGENNFEFNPQEQDNIKINCIFNKNLGIRKGTIKFDFTYSFPIEVYLPIFILNEGFEGFFGSDLAFQELESGKYNQYKSSVPSKMKYDNNVEVKINFADQPLAVGEEYTLAFQFKNNNIKNKADIKSFNIELPKGLELSDCKYLDNQGNFIKNYFNTTNTQLNTDDGETYPFKCKIRIGKEALGNSIGEIVKIQDIKAELNYDYILKKEIDIKID